MITSSSGGRGPDSILFVLHSKGRIRVFTDRLETGEVVVAIFRFNSALVVGPALVALAVMAAGYAFWLRRGRLGQAVFEGEAASGEAVLEPAFRKNPLEINSALLFAVMFAVISLVTKYVLEYLKEGGLRWLSFVVGFSDITPFVVSVLQGNYGIGDRQIVQAVVIASASNNLLKTAYTYAFGTRRTANLAAPGMIGLAVVSIAYAVIGL